MAISLEPQIRDARIQVGNALMDIEQTAILELFDFYYDVNLPPFRFHGGTNGIEKNIIYAKNV